MSPDKMKRICCSQTCLTRTKRSPSGLKEKATCNSNSHTKIKITGKGNYTGTYKKTVGFLSLCNKLRKHTTQYNTRLLLHSFKVLARLFPSLTGECFQAHSWCQQINFLATVRKRVSASCWLEVVVPRDNSRFLSRGFSHHGCLPHQGSKESLPLQ